MAFWQTGRKQRINHIKLVFQNVLAGQEMLTICLAIYRDDEVAQERFQWTTHRLAHSRLLMRELCDPNTKLSDHNAAEQLRVNEAYRKDYEVARSIFQGVHLAHFSEAFSPNCGWDVFVKAFGDNPVDVVKQYAPFWEDPSNS
jgi:hypothetical protein